MSACRSRSAALGVSGPRDCRSPSSSNDLRSTQSVTRAEGFEKLPHDYDGWRPIPKLGAPTGELGRPVLREERNVGLDPYGSNFKPNPEEDAERVARLRLQDEAEAAAKAQVFFQISHTGESSSANAGGVASAADMPAGEQAARIDGRGRRSRPKAQSRGFWIAIQIPKIYAAGQLQQARSPYELMAGTVIPAALVTGINSDLPGQMIATVTQNVYDTVTGDYLLIPQAPECWDNTMRRWRTVNGGCSSYGRA